MRRDKSENQIIRFDGKNVFFEVLKDGFNIEQVHIHFVRYDTNREQKDRIVDQADIYLDFPVFTVLINDMRSGRLLALANQKKKEAEAAKKQYADHFYLHQGGMSRERLKAAGKEREDGKALAREFKLTPANSEKAPWLITGNLGAGEENDTGLIQLRGRPEVSIMVPLSNDDIKKFFYYTEKHIDAHIASQYTKEMLTKGDFLINMFKKALSIFSAEKNKSKGADKQSA